jgi:hypothetical protein
MAILTFTGTTPGTFSIAANWSPAQVPTIADICIFTSSSPTCSLILMATCSQIDFTNYNKRITFGTNALLVAGNITLGNQMSFSFSTTAAFNGYNLIMSASGSIITNGMTMGVPFGFYNRSANNTYTLLDNLICAENFSTGANAGALTHTINGFTISCYKNVGINIGSLSSTTFTTGTTNIIMLGTNPTLTSGGAATNGLANNFTINITGNLTLSGTIYYKLGTFRLITGRMLTSTLSILGNTTLDFSGSNSGNIQNMTLSSLITGNTITLLSDLHILGFAVSTITTTTINGADIYAYGTAPISVQGASTVTGTSTLRISGTSSASTATIGNSGIIGTNISIQTPGTVNWNQVQWYAKSGGASLVYTSGTMLYNGQNFQIGNSSNQHTFFTSGMTFNNITSFNSNPVNVNLQQPLYTTLLSVNTNPTTFTGSYGFSVSTLSGTTPPSPGRIGLSLQPNITYLVNRNLTIQPNVLNGFIFGIKSNIVGQQAKFILASGASQSLYTAVTDNIDSSGGQTIWPYYYDVATASTNTLNWKRLQSFSLQSSMLNIS